MTNEPCLTAVARALRQVADSKARTQDEAAEWKRKYELEVVRCQHLRQSIAKLSSNNQGELTELISNLGLLCGPFDISIFCSYLFLSIQKSVDADYSRELGKRLEHECGLFFRCVGHQALKFHVPCQYDDETSM